MGEIRAAANVNPLSFPPGIVAVAEPRMWLARPTNPDGSCRSIGAGFRPCVQRNHSRVH